LNASATLSTFVAAGVVAFLGADAAFSRHALLLRN